MEYVDGVNAKTWVEQQPKLLPVRTAVNIIGRVLDALTYAHDRGFVHRDVKPTNIMIAQTGKTLHVKLADFGLARAYQESKLSGLTMTGDMCSTPKFMAPEQITDSRTVQPACDQYAAATLYWLLTKQHTHDFGPRVHDVLQRILLETPVPLTTRRPSLPPALAEAVHRALQSTPAARFASADEFRSALKSAT